MCWGSQICFLSGFYSETSCQLTRVPEEWTFLAINNWETDVHRSPWKISLSTSMTEKKWKWVMASFLLVQMQTRASFLNILGRKRILLRNKESPCITSRKAGSQQHHFGACYKKKLGMFQMGAHSTQNHRREPCSLRRTWGFTIWILATVAWLPITAKLLVCNANHHCAKWLVSEMWPPRERGRADIAFSSPAVVSLLKAQKQSKKPRWGFTGIGKSKDFLEACHGSRWGKCKLEQLVWSFAASNFAGHT